MAGCDHIINLFMKIINFYSSTILISLITTIFVLSLILFIMIINLVNLLISFQLFMHKNNL